jgi:hypothetical protein
MSEQELRDYFAAAALTGLLANTDHDLMQSSEYASDAYIFADAMLKERKRDAD